MPWNSLLCVQLRGRPVGLADGLTRKSKLPLCAEEFYWCRETALCLELPAVCAPPPLHHPHPHPHPTPTPTATLSTPHPWWRHQMETFSALLALVRGIYRSPVNSLHKDQWRTCAWINGWVNDRDAGDLRRHRTHHDVTVMYVAIVIVGVVKVTNT